MISKKGAAVVIEGEMTLDTVPAMVDGLAAHLGRGENCIDLSGVSEVDSSAVALLLEWQRQAAGLGVTLRWTNIPAALGNLARLYGVQEILPLAG